MRLEDAIRIDELIKQLNRLSEYSRKGAVLAILERDIEFLKGSGYKILSEEELLLRYGVLPDESQEKLQELNKKYSRQISEVQELQAELYSIKRFLRSRKTNAQLRARFQDANRDITILQSSVQDADRLLRTVSDFVKMSNGDYLKRQKYVGDLQDIGFEPTIVQIRQSIYGKFVKFGIKEGYCQWTEKNDLTITPKVVECRESGDFLKSDTPIPFEELTCIDDIARQEFEEKVKEFLFSVLKHPTSREKLVFPDRAYVMSANIKTNNFKIIREENIGRTKGYYPESDHGGLWEWHWEPVEVDLYAYFLEGRAEFDLECKRGRKWEISTS